MAKKVAELQMKVDGASVQPGVDDAQRRLGAFKKWQDDQNAKGSVLGASKSSAEQLGRVGQAMAVIAAGAAAVQVGIKGWEIASATFSGDSERRAKALAELADELKQLPLGIGNAVKASESLLGLVTGIKAETEAINKQADEQNKTIEYRAKLLTAEKQRWVDITAETKKASDAANSRGRSTRDRVDAALLANNPEDFGLKRGILNRDINREIESETNNLTQAQARVKSRRETYESTIPAANIARLSGGGDGQAISAEARAKAALDAANEVYTRLVSNVASLEDLRAQSLYKIDQEEAESLKKKAEAETKAEEDRVRKAEQSAKKRAAIEQALSDTTNAAIADQAKAEIAELRVVGREKEAARKEVIEGYEQAVVAAQRAAARIMEAEEATPQDKATAQGVLSGSVDRAARERDYKLALLNQPNNQQTPDLAMRSSRFLTGASDKSDPQIKLNKSIDELVAQTRRANDLEERRQQVQANAQAFEISIGNGEI